MKKLSLIIALFGLSLGLMAQGKSHGKGKSKNKVEHENNGGDIISTSPGKGSNHQPKKVQEALYRDYPSARNVVWSKYKGDYTATFGNGLFRSAAVYHANGERKDTRTPLTRQQLPGGSIWDKIFKRDNITPVSYTQIEQPSVATRIYRILAGNNTAYFYDANGNRVNYDY